MEKDQGVAQNKEFMTHFSTGSSVLSAKASAAAAVMVKDLRVALMEGTTTRKVAREGATKDGRMIPTCETTKSDQT